jgi:mono/diheme cytochrome c family protein
MQETMMIRRVTIAFAALFALSSPAAAQSVEKGKEIYTAQRCSLCHSVGDVGNKRGSLDKVGAKLTAADIRNWIVAAPEMAAKTTSERKPVMKAYTTLTKEEVDSLVAYLQTLK